MSLEDELGMIIRSKAGQQLEEGRASVYHLNREESNGSKSNLEKLKVKRSGRWGGHPPQIRRTSPLRRRGDGLSPPQVALEPAERGRQTQQVSGNNVKEINSVCMEKLRRESYDGERLASEKRTAPMDPGKGEKSWRVTESEKIQTLSPPKVAVKPAERGRALSQVSVFS